MSGADPVPTRPGRGRSVRVRLLVIALLPMLVLLPLLIGITMQRWIWRTDQVIAARVAADLTVARQYLGHLIDNTDQQIAAFGQSVAFQQGMTRDPAGFLDRQRGVLGLDFLGLSEDAPTGSGIEVLDEAALAALAPDLATRARITLPGTGRTPGTVETRGLVIRATTPVTLPGGRTTRLSGGVLLNKNDDFVDRINDLVYPEANPAIETGVARAFDRGLTTLFLDDIRIATTLRPTPGGGRAIGTRASDAVRVKVLDQGGSWHDTAFVVNGWYVSAYEAISDRNGARVGMIYTGIPRAPYTAARRDTWMLIGAAFLGVSLLSVPLFLHWARGIFRPLEAMGDTMARVRGGDFDARALGEDPPPGADEILRLARDLDRLLDLLGTRETELRMLNAALNTRVEERTSELIRANRALADATRQLVLSEKLATIGEVTAGIAHEINNPLAVIQGNLEVLRLILAERETEAATELRLIDEQITRVGALVNQLLQFSRPDEFGDMGEDCDPAPVARGIEPLVRHLTGPAQVSIKITPASRRSVRMARHELQQVLVNLATNAVQAMPDGGQLHIMTEDADGTDGRPGVRISIIDTGKGMDEATRTRIFDPFFTTRGIRGTGLGLPICQALVNRRGGVMRCDSSPGAGTTFTLWLPTDHDPRQA